MTLQPPPNPDPLQLPLVDLHELSIGFKDALSVRVGDEVSRQTIQLAQSRFLDHLIVTDPAGIPVGFIALQTLLEALSTPGPCHIAVQHVFKHTLPRHTRIDALLEAFESRSIAAVIDPQTQSSRRFITFSDLNKHPVRSAMYPTFAELEAHLATIIERRHEDPWSWIAQLDRDKQARIVGYWELSRRDKVDIGPIAGATLNELFTIVRKDADLRQTLGIPQGNRWDSLAHGINELRNLVMHPVRPMFASPTDLARTRARLADLARLTAITKHLALSPDA